MPILGNVVSPVRSNQRCRSESISSSPSHVYCSVHPLFSDSTIFAFPIYPMFCWDLKLLLKENERFTCVRVFLKGFSGDVNGQDVLSMNFRFRSSAIRHLFDVADELTSGVFYGLPREDDTRIHIDVIPHPLEYLGV